MSAETDADTTSAQAATDTGSRAPLPVTEVTMHPLVLLSAADHYHRIARGTRKRVVGVLLGQVHKGRLDASNSFAVPFEEDSKNPAVWILDHNYLVNMAGMFRKINVKERVVGFYSTGPQIRPNDLRIHDVVQKFTATACVFCIIDIRPDRHDLPVAAYTVVEDTNSSNRKGTTVQRTFAHLPVQMGAMEAEEIGVEHLLRDINDPTISSVATLIKGKIAGLSTLAEKLLECQEYLVRVADKGNGNPEIVANLQTILSLLPNLNTPDLVKSLIVKTNDFYMAIYLAALIRSVLALHDLVNNKIQYGQDGEEEKKEEVVDTKKDVKGKDVKVESSDVKNKK